MLWLTLVLWLLLVLVAALFLFLVGRSTYRKAKAMVVDAGTAGARLQAVVDEMQTLAARPAPPPAATVFTDPAVVRQQQKAAAKQAHRHRKPSGRRAAPRGRGRSALLRR